MTNKIQISEKVKDYLSLFAFMGYCTACGMLIEKALHYDDIKRAYNKGVIDACDTIRKTLEKALSKSPSVKKEVNSDQVDQLLEKTRSQVASAKLKNQ